MTDARLIESYVEVPVQPNTAPPAALVESYVEVLVQPSSAPSARLIESYVEVIVQMPPKVATTNPSASSTTGGSPASNAFDDSVATQWLSSAQINGASIKADVVSPAIVKAYAVAGTTSGHESKSPKTWVLQGSNDGTNWTTVDTQSNVTAFVASEKRLYALAVATGYASWRLLFTSNQGDATTVGLSEFALYGDPPPPNTSGLGALPV